MTQRYRYEVTSVWGSYENHHQVKIGGTVIDVDKCLPGDNEAQWDIFNFDEGKMVGGFTGKKLGPFEEPEEKS